MFRDVALAQLEKLTAQSQVHALRPRQALYEQGERARSCFVVLSGTLRLRVRLGKQTATSGLAFANDIVGLEALMNDGCRQESAIAGGPVEVLDIAGERLRAFLIDNPGLQFELLQYVIASLFQKSSHAVHTGHYDAEQRLAAYLVNHCDHPLRNAETAGGISQADLADYLALTPETLCRKVSKFRKMGWIGGRGNDYVIKKPAALQELLKE